MTREPSHTIKPSHTYTGKVDNQGSPDALHGLHVTILQRGAYAQSGFNCTILLHCTAQQLADRHNLAQDPRRTAYTAAEVGRLYGREPDCMDGWLVVEADTDSLTEGLLDLQPLTAGGPGAQ